MSGREGSCRHVYRRQRRRLLSAALCFVLIGALAVGAGACGSEPVESAIDEDNQAKALAALEQVADEADLMRVALEARLAPIRAAAARQVSDSAALARLALESDSSVIREQVVERIDDQSVLLQVALRGGSEGERVAAVARLTSAEDLAAVVLGLGLGTEPSGDADSDDVVLNEALSRLTQPDMLASLDSADVETNVRSLARYLKAMSNVPEERRQHFLSSTLPIVWFLMDPQVAGVAGEIAAVKAGYSEINASHLYGGAPVTGEAFKLWIETTELSEPVGGSWRSDFGTYVETSEGKGFVPVEISLAAVLDPVLSRVSAAQQAQIAEEHHDADVRLAVTQLLDAQTVLGRIAVEDSDYKVRAAATAKLTDAELLARIADQDSALRVRRVAKLRLEELAAAP